MEKKPKPHGVHECEAARVAYEPALHATHVVPLPGAKPGAQPYVEFCTHASDVAEPGEGHTVYSGHS